LAVVELTFVTVGAVVSMMMFFWPPRLEAPPTVGSVSVALFVALSLIVPPANASGIVTFYREGAGMAALYEKLEAANIIASLRADRSGRQHLRLSPHFYNTDAELQRVVQLL